MVYVLIVVGYLSGYVGGPITTFQEFTSVERCKAAAAVVVAYTDSDRHVKAECVPK